MQHSYSTRLAIVIMFNSVNTDRNNYLLLGCGAKDQVHQSCRLVCAAVSVDPQNSSVHCPSVPRSMLHHASATL
ncbi:hypothetical protein J6590_079092 [Homalodisca vitripennis]|nr:hypothetical protein J6590_079092 [Homalodisca vitripennis]